MGCGDAIALARQVLLDDLADLLLIVDDQDVGVVVHAIRMLSPGDACSRKGPAPGLRAPLFGHTYGYKILQKTVPMTSIDYTPPIDCPPSDRPRGRFSPKRGHSWLILSGTSKPKSRACDGMPALSRAIWCPPMISSRIV